MRHNLIKVACVTIALLLASYAIYVQMTTKPPEASIYRDSAAKVNSLVHTKLDLKFDYAQRYLYGKEWATFKPYAYTTDSLSLDARGRY